MSYIMSASILPVWAGRVYEIIGLREWLLVKPAPTTAQIIQKRIYRTGYYSLLFRGLKLWGRGL